MSLEDTAAATAGEGAAAPEITDTRSAAVAFEGLLDDIAAAGEDGADDTESDASASDAGTDENPSTGDEEGQTETPADKAASIEPPNSWSAEEKALFTKLPPEAQAVVARREGERDKQLLQRGEEVATQRKAHEAERTAIQTERQTYLQSLQQLTALALPEADQFRNVNWTELAAKEPAEYVRLSAARDQLRDRIGALQAETQRVQQAQDEDRQKQFQGIRQEQQRLLVEKIPDFGDPQKAPALAKDLRGWLNGQGFDDAEIGQVMDHRVINLAVNAMRADSAAKAAAAALLKRSNTPPNVQRAGTAQGSDTGTAKQAQERSDRLRQTGNVRDAAKLFELMI